MTSVLICDNRQAARDGLIAAASAVAGISRIECVDVERLLAHYAARPSDLVLVGIQRARPVGVTVVQRLGVIHPEAKVIVFGGRDDSTMLEVAISTAGVQGCLRWDAPFEGDPVAHSLIAAVAPRPRGLVDSETQYSDRPKLTERELQVLHGMSQGKTNKQLGKELFLSEDTIKTHAKRLFRKIGVADRAGAVAYGFRLGLVV
jgi:DNA-binding NarL/FixJ family response regulator